MIVNGHNVVYNLTHVRSSVDPRADAATRRRTRLRMSNIDRSGGDSLECEQTSDNKKSQRRNNHEENFIPADADRCGRARHLWRLGHFQAGQVQRTSARWTRLL